MDLGGSCSGLLSHQLGNSLALTDSAAQGAKGLRSCMAAPGEGSATHCGLARTGSYSLGDGGSKGYEAEPEFTPKIFRGKVQSVFQTYGWIRLTKS